MNTKDKAALTQTAMAAAVAATVPVMIDLDSIDAVAACGGGFEFELKGLDGVNGTGIMLVVQGKHADEVFTHMAATVQAAALEMQMAQRAGKAPEPKTLEQLREQNIAAAAVRVIGWGANILQPFARETVKALLRRNPHFIDQIVSKSDDLGNFNKKPLSS